MKSLSGGERNGDLEIQVALYQNLIDLRGRDTQAIIEQNKAEIELADAGTFHVEQLRANVLSHLAGQKTVTETLSDSIIGIYDKIGAASDKFLDKSVGKIPILGDLAKNFARQGLSSLTHGLLDQFFPGLGGGIKPTGNPVLDEAKTQTKHLENIDNALSGKFSFGGTGAISGAGGAAAGGGIFGAIIGSIKKLFGGGSSSPPSGAASGGLNNPAVIQNLLGGRSGAGTSAGSGISGFFGSLFGGGSGTATFNGSPIGGASGGGSVFAGLGQYTPGRGGGIGSQVLGALGGAGGTGGGSPLSGLFSAQGISGAIASGGITAAIALAQTALTTHSPLVGLATGGLIGLLFGNLNRGRRRRREEVLRTQYLNDAVGGLSAFDDLIRDLRGLRVTSDQAITQGTTLGQTLRANYLTQAGALKDKRTRETALRSVSELDFKIAQKLAELRGAADFANAAVDRKNRIIPEFAKGGAVRDAFMQRSVKQFQGLVPGMYDRKDDKIIKVSGNEVVLTPEHWQPITHYLKSRQVPGFANGGYVAPVFAPTVQPTVSTSNFQNTAANNPQPINITIVVEGEIDAARIKDVSIEGLISEKGIRQVVNAVKIAKLNNKL